MTIAAITILTDYIGPMGWVGWGVAIVLAGILWHLWRRSGPSQLRRMNADMADARKVMAEQKKVMSEQSEKIMALTNRNEELSTKLHVATRLNEELTGKIERMVQANELLDGIVKEQGRTLAALTRRLGEHEKHIMKLVTAAGGTIDLGNLLKDVE